MKRVKIHRKIMISYSIVKTKNQMNGFLQKYMVINEPVEIEQNVINFSSSSKSTEIMRLHSMYRSTPKHFLIWPTSAQ